MHWKTPIPPQAGAVDVQALPGQRLLVEPQLPDVTGGHIRLDQAQQQRAGRCIDIALGMGQMQVDLHVHATGLADLRHRRIEVLVGRHQVEHFAHMGLIGLSQVQLAAVADKGLSAEGLRNSAPGADAHHGSGRRAARLGSRLGEILHGRLQQAVLLQGNGLDHLAAQVLADTAERAPGDFQGVVFDVEAPMPLAVQESLEPFGTEFIQRLQTVQHPVQGFTGALAVGIRLLDGLQYVGVSLDQPGRQRVMQDLRFIQVAGDIQQRRHQLVVGHRLERLGQISGLRHSQCSFIALNNDARR